MDFQHAIKMTTISFSAQLIGATLDKLFNFIVITLMNSWKLSHNAMISSVHLVLNKQVNTQIFYTDMSVHSYIIITTE
jgi:hypothetical protein